MSKISVTTIAGLTSGGDANKVKIESGDTLQVESNATVGGTLGVTGTTTTAGITSTGRHDVNFNGSATQAFKYTDTGGGNLASFGQFYNSSNTLIGNIQNAGNAGVHLNVGSGSVCFTQIGYTAANALDDYEIGTYAPSYYGSSTAGSQSYSTQHGSYVKIGNLCQVWIDITLSAASGSNGTSNLSLPFAAASSAPLNSAGSQNMGNWWFWDMNNNFTGGSTPSGWIPQSANYAHMYITNGAASGHSNMAINTTGRIACSVIYFTG